MNVPCQIADLKIDREKHVKLKLKVPPLWNGKMMDLFSEEGRNYAVKVLDSALTAEFGGYAVDKEMVGTLKLEVSSRFLADAVKLIKSLGEAVEVKIVVAARDVEISVGEG